MGMVGLSLRASPASLDVHDSLVPFFLRGMFLI
jgi:hypothetical protein